MTTTRRYLFPNDVTVEVHTDRRHVETRFPDGSTAHATPWDDEPSYRKRALDHGYDGPDPCWDLCRDHELAHTFLAWSLRDETSLALWLAAHGVTDTALAHPALWREEAEVLAFQSKLTRRPFPPPPWLRYGRNEGAA